MLQLWREFQLMFGPTSSEQFCNDILVLNIQ